MGSYIARRLIYLVAVLFVVSGITFTLMHAVPGGPFDREKKLPPEIMRNLEKRYNLDEPLLVQYIEYMSEIVIPKFSLEEPGNTFEEEALIMTKIGPIYFTWMNFGPSFSHRSRTVNDIFRDQLPISAQLGVMALFVAILIGLPLGIISALKQNTIVDYVGMGCAIVGVSVPVIVLGPIMVYLFGVQLGWLPPTGWGAQPPYILGFLPSRLGYNYWIHAIMPAVALGLGSSAIIARLSRASLLQVIREDYIRTARAKGLQEKYVVTRHALKNSLIPVITILGPLFAALVTGTFVTELVFGIPGMGKYFVTSITARDYPVIMGTILLYALFLVVANLIVDIVYGYLDPRIRFD